MPSPGSGMPGGGIPAPMPGSSGAGGSGDTAGTQGQGDDGEGAASGESQSGAETGSESGAGTAVEGGSEGDGDGSVAGGADIPIWEPQPSFGDQDAEESSEPYGGGGNPNANVSLEEMEKTLEEAMGTFDEEILREQENARNQTGNNGAGTEARNGDVIAGVGEFETYGGDSSTSSNTNTAGSSRTAGPGGGGGGHANEDAPPPASDDDIVARQIREAAMNEPDPEQRAILWEEYERYKSGL